MAMNDHPMNLPNGNFRTFYLCTRCCAPESPTRPIKRCGGCQLSAYCSKDCQSNDRTTHKPLCKMFPVVNGFNALHTKGSWEEHLAGLVKRASLLPFAGTKTENDYVDINGIFQDPKVCYTCRHESRPELLTMCKCSCVCYCSKKCTRADRQHKKICSELCRRKEEYCQMQLRPSYIITLWYGLELVSNEYRPLRASLLYNCVVKLKVHVVTSTTYFDTKAWEFIFHQGKFLNLKELEIVFIIQDGRSNQTLNSNERITQEECDICENDYHRKHVITSSVHRKPYHMFFSSPEYSEPDMVIVYGFSGNKKDMHSEISYRNMTYSQDTLLILTDSTLELVAEGVQAVNKARPVDTLVPPILNRGRGFGSHRLKSDYDIYATNDRYYLTCLRRK